MKVAIMIDSLAIGGAQKHVRQLACRLAEKGYTVNAYVLNDVVEPMYRRPLEEAGVRVVVVGRWNVLTGIGVFTTAWRLRRDRVQVMVHVLFVSTIFGRITAHLAGGIGILTSLQARNLDYKWWQKILLRSTSHLSHFTISNSHAALPWAAKHEGTDLRRSAYVPNASEPRPLVEESPSWSDLGLPELEGKRVIGSLGRLNSQKGYDILLEALASIAPEARSSVAVVVFGEGPERTVLEVRRNELCLEGVVFFPGQRSDAVHILPKFELYVQPSRFEGTPQAVIEALAAGLPVLASAVDGIREIAECAPAGTVVLCSNMADFSAAIAHFIYSSPSLGVPALRSKAGGLGKNQNDPLALIEQILCSLSEKEKAPVSNFI